MSNPYKRRHITAHCATCEATREPLVKLCCLIQWSHGLCQLRFWCITCQRFQLSTFNARMVHRLLDCGVPLIELDQPDIKMPHRPEITENDLMVYHDLDAELVDLLNEGK